MSRSFTAANSDKVDWGDLAATDGLSKLTLNLWVYPGLAADWECLVSDIGAATGAGITHGWMLQYYLHAGDVIALACNGSLTYGWTNGANPLTANTWKNIHMVYDGTQTGNSNRLRLWVAGSEQTLAYDSTTIPASLAANDQSLLYGHDNADPTIWYGGRLAEVAIWAGVAITTSTTISNLNSGWSPAFYGSLASAGNFHYAPLTGDVLDMGGMAGVPTVSGTALAAHPTIYYPPPRFARQYRTRR